MEIEQRYHCCGRDGRSRIAGVTLCSFSFFISVVNPPLTASPPQTQRGTVDAENSDLSADNAAAIDQ